MNRDNAEQLILQAFQQARVSGKQDWHRMTTAVLKNRMLTLTDYTFKEGDYGAANFTMFILKCRHLVEIDQSTFPPMVELRTPEASKLADHHADPMPTRARVRSDLWRAALDYSSGTEYVWDTIDGQARPGRAGEESSQTLPTVTKAVHQQWRTEFIGSVMPSTAITPEQQNQAMAWVQDQLPTSHLPRPLIPLWNGFLRDKVHQHLLSWFAEVDLEPPSDTMTYVVERTPRLSTETEFLRRLVVRVVGAMTEHELAQLNLPARAVFRVTRQPKS